MSRKSNMRLGNCFVTITFFFFFITAPGAAVDIFKAFPELEAQLASNLTDGIDRELVTARLKEYFRPADEEMHLGMRMLLSCDEKLCQEPNYALQLLLHLLNESRYTPGDTMTIALALANNKLYASVNEAIRAEIKKDLVQHYDFYHELVAWQQQKFEIRIDLSRAPLIPKLYWADRTAYPPEGISYGIKTIDDYHEYVDTIETMSYFHGLVEQYQLYRGITISQISRKVNAFIHDKDAQGFKRHLYNPNAETIRTIFDRIPHDSKQTEVLPDRKILYRGRSININGFIWINYQRKLYESLGQSIGLCEVSSLIELALFKGLGLGAGLMIRNQPKNSPIPGHVFAMYYDQCRQRWNNLEMIKSYNHPLEMELVIAKPVWQTRVSELCNKIKEKAMAPRFFKLLNIGIQRKYFDTCFFSDSPVLTDTIFSNAALPDELSDRDKDSFYDFEETLLGLNPERADSAGDGVTDLWKLLHGFEPLKPLPENAWLTPPIDGMDGGYQFKDDLKTIKVKRYNGKPKSDDYRELDTMSAVLLDDKIYICITFHNDIRKTTEHEHYLSITNMEGSGNIDAFDFYVEGGSAYASSKAKLKSPDKFADLRGYAYRNVELLIPVKYFDGAKSIVIKYFKALVRGQMAFHLSGT